MMTTNLSFGISPAILIFIFSILFALPLSAQEVLWQKDIQSSTQDILSGMTLTIDRQILLAGSSINHERQESKSGFDYHIIKLSQEGVFLWEKYYGGEKNDYLNSLISVSDGGFLLSGTSLSNRAVDKKEKAPGGSDIWIIRTDENGDELWQTTIGTKNNDEASAVTESTDNGFFVSGNINSNKYLFGSKDVFISKLDENGKPVQTIILGGKSIDEITNMAATPDGGAIVLIYSASGKSDNITNHEISQNENDLMHMATSFIGKTEDSLGEGDYWIVKLDKDANVEWQKTYGGEKDDYPKIITFTNNGYIVAGESKSGSSGTKKTDTVDGTDLWIISIDHSGNELWQKSYSLGSRDILMSMNVIRNSSSEDKGFLLGGYTQTEEETRRNDEKFWLLYLDEEGNEEWRKHVEGKAGKKEEHLVSARLQNDGTFIMAGTSSEISGKENWKVVKLGDNQLYDLIEKKEIRIYPNPAEEYCYVEIGFPLEKDEEAEISLYDMSGRKMSFTKTRNEVTKIDTGILPPGVYTVTVKTSKKTVSSKLIKK